MCFSKVIPSATMSLLGVPEFSAFPPVFTSSTTTPTPLTGIRLNPCVTPLWGGPSGHLADPTPNTLPKRETCHALRAILRWRTTSWWMNMSAWAMRMDLTNVSKWKHTGLERGPASLWVLGWKLLSCRVWCGSVSCSVHASSGVACCEQEMRPSAWWERARC